MAQDIVLNVAGGRSAAIAIGADLFAPAARPNGAVRARSSIAGRLPALPIVTRRAIGMVVTACLAGVFIWSGYWLSDDRFFAQLMAREHIASVDDAFQFVREHTSYPSAGMQVAVRRTPRQMLMRQRFLFCDQSAIVLATIVHKLGYDTSLIDLHGPDGESHHTVLGVREHGSWTVYDVAYNLRGHSLTDSARYSVTGTRFAPVPVYRAYPRSYHWAMQHNVFVQRFALWLKAQ